MPIDDELSMQSIYNEIVKTRNELKNIIEATEARVVFKAEEIKNKVSKLEKENDQLKEKVEYLERQAKRKNIIIFGIKKPSRDISTEYICQEINSLLEINLVQEDICDIYPLGKKDNRPIKIELISQIKKKLIIQNRYKLKGKSISIADDLTVTQREETNILRKHLLVARENPENTCFIKKDKLILNNKIYTAKDLEEYNQFEETNIRQKNNSAPPTPHKSYSAKLSDKVSDQTLADTQAEVSLPDRANKNTELTQEKLQVDTSDPTLADTQAEASLPETTNRNIELIQEKLQIDTALGYNLSSSLRKQAISKKEKPTTRSTSSSKKQTFQLVL